MTTSVLFTILLVGSVVGPLFLGLTSDRFGRIRILRTTLLLSSLCIFSLVLSRNNLSLIIPVLLAMGFANYSFATLFQAMLADVANPSIRDLAFSLYFPLSFALGAIWSFGLGLVADRFSFQLLFTIAAFAPLSALPFTFLIKE